MVPTPATLPSLFRPALWSHDGGSLWSADRGRRDAGLDYRWLCTISRHTWKWTAAAPQSLSGALRRTAVKEILPVGKTMSSESSCSLCLEGKMGRWVVMHLFISCGQWFDWLVRGLEETTDWVLEIKEQRQKWKATGLRRNQQVRQVRDLQNCLITINWTYIYWVRGNINFTYLYVKYSGAL